MKRLLPVSVSVIAFLVFAGTTAKAELLSPEEALARVLTEKTPQKAASKVLRSTSLVHTVYAAEQPAEYIFNVGSDGGYMVVSADDKAVALLGFADSGSFDPENIPENMQSWLQSYADDIAAARDSEENGGDDLSGSVMYSIDSTEPSKMRPDIDPLCQTHWDQDAPFNNLCPVSNSEKCVTGCVATAMAQVMAYYKYPKKGTGSISYTTSTLGLSLSMDFSATTFDWDNILDSYTGEYSDAQATAVATLMKACGYSVSMNYNVASKGGSGAYSSDVAIALSKYFGYNNMAHDCRRYDYTTSEWADMVYEQLKTYGPVLYHGTSSSGGHAFVCDGYTDTDYFHINWGWSGVSDGYFKLYALDPPLQGIGGAADGFNRNQGFIGFVVPEAGGDYYYELSSDSSLAMSLSSNKVTISNGIYNYGNATIPSGYTRLCAEDASGNKYYGAVASFTDLMVNYGWSKMIRTLPTSLSNGTYKLYLVYGIGDNSSTCEYKQVQYPLGCINFYYLTVNNGTYTLSAVPLATITLTNCSFKHSPYLSSTCDITATVTNSSNVEYLGNILVLGLNSSGKIALKSNYLPTVVPGSGTIDRTYQVYFSYSSANYKSGEEYTFYFCVADGTSEVPISDGFKATVTDNAPAATIQTISDLKVNGEANATEVHRLNIRLNFTLNCTSGYFGNALLGYIFKYPEGGYSVAYFVTPVICASTGESVPVETVTTFPEAEFNRQYFVQLHNGSSWVSNQAVFSTGSNLPLGVEDVSTDASEVVSEEYFTLQGVPVANSGTLLPGHYVKVSCFSDGSRKSGVVVVR